MIEDFLPSKWRDEKLGGKALNLGKDIDITKEYGKALFAEHVIKKNWKDVEFHAMRAILDRIVTVIDDYAAMMAAGSQPHRLDVNPTVDAAQMGAGLLQPLVPSAACEAPPQRVRLEDVTRLNKRPIISGFSSKAAIPVSHQKTAGPLDGIS